MIGSREDFEVLRSKEVQSLLKQYKEKFKEPFPHFNYVDFKSYGNKFPAQVYKEILEEAVKADTPYQMHSKVLDNEKILGNI